MEVILLDNVSKIGKVNEVKKVKSGYARNFLIPKGLAEPATKSNITSLKKRIEKAEEEKRLKMELLTKELEGLSKKTLVIEKKSTPEGHLFEGVDTEDIVKDLEAQLNIKLEKDMLTLEKPIKETGDFKIPVSVGDNKSELKLSIKSSV